MNSEPLPVDEQVPLPRPAVPDLDTLKGLDCADPDLLRPTLAALIEGRADRFDPVRFRFIEALERKAQKQRPSVARVLEKKALQALCEYLSAYLPARERAAALVARMASGTPEDADAIGRLFDTGDFQGGEQLAARIDRAEERRPGALAALTREMQQRGESAGSGPEPSFEDELRRQELEVMQSATGVATGGCGGVGMEPGQGGSGELTAMRSFRESLAQRNSERRVARAIQDGPENPGPLNSQALIIRSLSMMRDLSPSYSNRFVSYMETLLWLEQAGRAAAPAKSKGGGRRRT